MFGKKKQEPKVEETSEKDLKLIPGDENKEDWMTKKWRPLMAMMYMFCCLADFAIFPVMFTIVQFWETEAANDAFRQWVPITLQGGGLFHVAMGAVLGVSAYGRTQEKLGGAAGNTPAPLAPMGAGVPTPNLALNQTPGQQNMQYGAMAGGSPSFSQNKASGTIRPTAVSAAPISYANDMPADEPQVNVQVNVSAPREDSMPRPTVRRPI